MQSLKSGANDFVHKPFKREELLARIDTQLRLRDLSRLRQEATASLTLLRRMVRTLRAPPDPPQPPALRLGAVMPTSRYRPQCYDAVLHRGASINTAPTWHPLILCM